MKNTIVLGSNTEGYTTLPWTNSNGILLAGVAGSGKSTTASLYLTQYAYNGAKLIICDYGASAATSETLINRIEHLSSTFYWEPVTEAKDIVQYIEDIRDLCDKRYRGLYSSDVPIIFVIDEFPAFIMQYKPPVKKYVSRERIDENTIATETQSEPTFLEKLIETILKCRKINIHFMFIGQEWAQMGTVGIRALRSNMTDVILHRLDAKVSSLFGMDDAQTKRLIQNLQIGQVYYRGSVLKVPQYTDKINQQIIERLKTMRPALQKKQVSDDLFLSEMIQKYQYKVDQRQLKAIFDNIHSLSDLCHYASMAGKSNTWVMDMIKEYNNG